MLCEIVLIYYIQKQIGEAVERSGRDSTLMRILFVVSWIIAEILGISIGIALSDSLFVGYLFALIAVVSVTVAFMVIAHSLPSTDQIRRGRKRTYMDDYYEYGATGRVDTRPVPGDPEEEEDRPRRRRKKRREPDDDDPPRRDDERIRNEEREDTREEKRPRRRPRREDEDY